MPTTELEMFLAAWEREAASTVNMWNYILAHGIHHRGQLTLMCRLAGGQCPGLYGPNREEMAAMRASAGAS